MSDTKRFFKTGFICLAIIAIELFLIYSYGQTKNYDDVTPIAGTVQDVRTTHDTRTKHKIATIEYINPTSNETIIKDFRYPMQKDLIVGQEITIYTDGKNVGTQAYLVSHKSHPGEAILLYLSWLPLILIPMIVVNTSFTNHQTGYKLFCLLIFYPISLSIMCCGYLMW